MSRLPPRATMSDPRLERLFDLAPHPAGSSDPVPSPSSGRSEPLKPGPEEHGPEELGSHERGAAEPRPAETGAPAERGPAEGAPEPEGLEGRLRVGAGRYWLAAGQAPSATSIRACADVAALQALAAALEAHSRALLIEWRPMLQSANAQRIPFTELRESVALMGALGRRLEALGEESGLSRLVAAIQSELPARYVEPARPAARSEGGGGAASGPGSRASGSRAPGSRASGSRSRGSAPGRRVWALGAEDPRRLALLAVLVVAALGFAGRAWMGAPQPQPETELGRLMQQRREAAPAEQAELDEAIEAQMLEDLEETLREQGLD